MTTEPADKFERLGEADLKAAFDLLFEDLCQRLRERDVSEDAIEGVQITLMIAFRLGEKHARKKS
jgi:hypothetical protein